MKLFTEFILSKRTKAILIFIITTFVVSSGFHKNRWGMIDQGFYQHWRDGFDEFVIGRLAMSKVDGMLSAGGLLLIGDTDQYDVTWRTIRHQTETYYQSEKFDTYWTYSSTPGFEGIVFSFFDKVTDFEPRINVTLFYWGTALISGAVLSIILLWIWFEFGFMAYFLSAVSVALSPWLQLMGGSLYWQLWSLYVPFVLTLLTLTYFNRHGSYVRRTMMLVIFCGVLTKVLFTGFEFITTVLISITVPFVYFMIRDNWHGKLFVKRLMDTVIFGGLATLLGLFVLLTQISSELGGYASAYRYIVDALNRRAVGNPAAYSGMYAEALASGRWQVIKTYLLGPAYGLNGHFTGGQTPGSVTYLSIFLVFFLFGGFLLWLAWKDKSESALKRKKLALLVTTGYSILAPLSWLIVFKAHAYIHINLDYFVWQLPFIPLGFALVGYTIVSLFHRNGHTSAGTYI